MPVFTLLLSLLVLSQSAVFVRMAAAPAVAIGFWRMVIALPVLMTILWWQKRGKELTVLDRRQWISLALCGFFLFAHFYTWFLSIQKTSLAHSMILFCANPLFTAIGAWMFFGERVTLRHGVALLFCFAGVYCLLSEKAAIHSLEGDLLGLLCSFLFSAYVLMGKGLRRRLANVPFALVTYGFTTLCFAFMMVALGLPFFAYGAQSWVAFSALAFGSTLLGHSLFTHCLQFFSVNFLSLSTMIEPVFTAISGAVFFGEPITRATVLGFFLVFLGILSLSLRRPRG